MDSYLWNDKRVKNSRNLKILENIFPKFKSLTDWNFTKLDQIEIAKNCSSEQIFLLDLHLKFYPFS